MENDEKKKTKGTKPVRENYNFAIQWIHGTILQTI